jgi:colanic acid/amylovoran biosynthesis glycosyltransferase
MVKSKIVLRVGSFPVLSESFIQDHAKIILELGFELEILVNESKYSEDVSEECSNQCSDLVNRTIELDNYWKLRNFARIKKISELLFFDFDWKSFNFFNPVKYGFGALYGGTFLDSYDLNKCKDASLVHVQFGYNITSLDKLKAAKILKSKLLVTFHGFDAFFNESTKTEKMKYYKLLFEVGDYFTCNTNYLKNYLLELGCPADKLEVVHVPVNTLNFNPSVKEPNEAPLVLLSVGRLIKLKGHHHGINVTKMLVDKGYDVIYQIIGDGPELDNLQKMVLSLNLMEKVKFLGSQPQHNVIKHMKSCDLFLMTSTSDASGRREAQGLVTIEAQACGKPVVAFESGGVPDTLINNTTGFLSKENDLLSMMRNIEQLINNPGLKQKMGKHAVEFVSENYSYSVVSKQWENIYSKLIP